MISIILLGTLLFLGIYALIEIITDYINQYYFLYNQGTIMELIDSIQENRTDPFARIMQIIFNAIKLCGITILDINWYQQQIDNDLELSEEILGEIDQCESDEEILEQLYSD